jgi:hypothetical protein
MLARGVVPADRRGAERLNYRGSRVMHAHDHRGRPTLTRETLNHQSCGAWAFAHPANLFGTDQAQQAGVPQGVDRCTRKRAGLIHFDRMRSNDAGCDSFKGFQIVRHSSLRASAEVVVAQRWPVMFSTTGRLWIFPPPHSPGGFSTCPTSSRVDMPYAIGSYRVSAMHQS